MGAGSEADAATTIVYSMAPLSCRIFTLGNRGALLADSAINTDQVVALVVDDGVQNYCGLARLAVADDQFALSASNGNHRVNGLDARGHRLPHRLAINYARRDSFNRDVLAGGDGAFVV